MNRQANGYTLIELSVVLVVLGIVMVLIWRFIGFDNSYAASQQQRDLLRSADQAVTGFVLSHDRLPCPDSNGDGSEDCSASIGTLPFLSIGLADASAAQIRYGVYRNASSAGIDDADLADTVDRMPMLVTQGSPLVGKDTLMGNANGIDLCAGLRNAAGKALNNALLHVVTPAGNVNVAYALAVSGGTDADQAGNVMDAGNAAAGLGFEAPSRVTDGGYDDRVVAVGFDRLIGRLGCSEALAAATHAHANAATEAEMMHQAMLDYKVQLDLINELAEANVESAAAAVAIAAAGAAAGAAEISLGLSESLATLGAASEVEALAIAGEVAAGIAVVSAAAAVAPAAAAKDAAQQNVDNFASQAFVTRSGDLATRIRADANAADAAGIY